MALTNHAWSTTSSAGWTGVINLAGVEFIAGGLHLKAGETYALVLSPALNPAAWGRIHDFALTYVEEINADAGEYRHQILISFDGGTTYYGPGANRLIEDASTGWVLEGLLAWREWPTAAEVVALGSSIKVLVAISRTAASAADGILATLSANEGTTQNIDIDGDAITLEPSEEDALPTFGLSTGTTYSGANPDWPLEMTLEMPVHESRHESGHIATYAHGTKFREVYTCHWGGRVDDSSASVTEATDLIAFLADHVDESFEWTPPGSGSARTFVSSHPSVEVKAQMGSGRRVVDISATWTEVNV
jgi:hypothetical protein